LYSTLCMHEGAQLYHCYLWAIEDSLSMHHPSLQWSRCNLSQLNIPCITNY